MSINELILLLSLAAGSPYAIERCEPAKECELRGAYRGPTDCSIAMVSETKRAPSGTRMACVDRRSREYR